MILEGRFFHEDFNEKLDHTSRAHIWNYYRDLFSKIHCEMGDAVSSIFNKPFEIPDIDADNFNAFFYLINEAVSALKKHCNVLNSRALHQDEPRVFWEQTVLAWSLGLKPAILREEGIPQLRYVEFPEWHSVSNWKEIAAFRPSQDFSEENTRTAIRLWREADYTGRDALRDACEEWKRIHNNRKAV